MGNSGAIVNISNEGYYPSGSANVNPAWGGCQQITVDVEVQHNPTTVGVQQSSSYFGVQQTPTAVRFQQNPTCLGFQNAAVTNHAAANDVVEMPERHESFNSASKMSDQYGSFNPTSEILERHKNFSPVSEMPKQHKDDYDPIQKMLKQPGSQSMGSKSLELHPIMKVLMDRINRTNQIIQNTEQTIQNTEQTIQNTEQTIQNTRRELMKRVEYTTNTRDVVLTNDDDITSIECDRDDGHNSGVATMIEYNITTPKAFEDVDGGADETQMPAGSLGGMCSMPTTPLHEDVRLSQVDNHDGILGRCPAEVCEVSVSPVCVSHDEPTGSKKLGGRTCQTKVLTPTEDAEHDSPSDAVSTEEVAKEQWKRTTAEDIRRTLCRPKPHHNRKRVRSEPWKVLSNVVKRWVPKEEAEAYQNPMSSKVTLTRTQKRRTQRRKNQQYWESRRECRPGLTPEKQKIQLVTMWVPKTKSTTADTAKQFTRTQKRRAQRRKNQQYRNSYREEQKSQAPMKSGIRWITMWAPKGKLTSSDVTKQPAIRVPKGYGVITHAVRNMKSRLTRTQKRRLHRRRAACIKKNANFSNTCVQAGLVKQVWMPKARSETISDIVDYVSARSSYSSTVDDLSENDDETEYVEANADRVTDPSDEVTADDDDKSECTSMGNEEAVDVVQHHPFLIMTTYVNPMFATELQHEHVSTPPGGITIDTLMTVQHDQSSDVANSIKEAVLGSSHLALISISDTLSSKQVLTGTPVPTSKTNRCESPIGACDYHVERQLNISESESHVITSNGIGRYRLPQLEQVLITSKFSSSVLKTFKPKPKSNGEWTQCEPKKLKVSVHDRPMIKKTSVHNRFGPEILAQAYGDFPEGLVRTQKKRLRRLKNQAHREKEERCIAKVSNRTKSDRVSRQKLKVQLVAERTELGSGDMVDTIQRKIIVQNDDGRKCRM